MTLFVLDATLTNNGTGDITDGTVTGEFQAASAATTYTVNANKVVLELAFEFDADVDLSSATKTTLLSAMGAADDSSSSNVTAGTLTMTAAGDEALLIAYQSSKAYFFKITSGADADITDADSDDTVELVATYNGITAGDFTYADFIA